jgi:5,6-dimethylbenzimidazole synthase
MTKRFSENEIAAIYKVVAERRDMRHFVSDPVDPALLERILQAAHQAPSVGFMQPWRFIRITDDCLRKNIHQLVEQERIETAKALGERENEFMQLKVEGILECGELIIVALMENRQQYIFGRRTMPEMDLASTACAIQNMWLTSRAEGLGMGWVSLFDPKKLQRLLDIPNDAKAIAILCLGHIAEFYSKPMLEKEKWANREKLQDLVYENTWKQKPEC